MQAYITAHYYECTDEIFSRLGEMYVADERFRKNIDKAGGDGTAERKMFPSYVLVKMIMNDVSWHIIRNTTGVTGFVGPGSSPVALSDAEVEKLGVETKVIEIKFAVGDNVRITGGALTGLIGLVEAISDDKQKVSVSANMFGRETKVEIDVSQVAPL